MDQTALAQRQLIREVIESWSICRDSGDWDGLRACYHPDGIMCATWFQGGVDRFVSGARESFGRAGMSGHILGGTRITLNGVRAIAQTRVTINSRDPIEGVLCDIACLGRMYDFFECREGIWAICLRQPIYERDRADPVTTGEIPKLDPELLASFPVGYRHLAYAQVKRGLPVKKDMPGLHGPEVAALYARGQAWLDGASLAEIS